MFKVLPLLLILGFSAAGFASELECIISNPTSMAQFNCGQFPGQDSCDFWAQAGSDTWTERFSQVPNGIRFEYSKNGQSAELLLTFGVAQSFSYPNDTEIYDILCNLK